VIDCVDWVNVCAITPDQKLVMIEQYRHGSDTIELEIPGGMMDAHEQNPLEAGLRELREETGYATQGGSAQIIGQMFPNAAIMSNRCSTVLLTQAECLHPTELDPGEDIHVRLVPLTDIPKLIATGKIRHAIVLAALCHLEMHLRVTP
jgi:8-oxo-dGTP pyrophosphatase MutT (NUDIX family)